MKKYIHLTILFLLTLHIFSCAPVIRKELMDTGIRNPSLTDIKQNPGKYMGKLCVLGGIINNTKVTAEGSLIEALYAPVDYRGYLKGAGTSYGRFLLLFPKESGILDPLIFKRDREITFAGEFAGLKEGKIDEMEYAYPLFRIREIYLWPESMEYLIVPPYYDPYPYWWGGPYRGWGGPYWWRYHAPPPYWW